MNYSITDFLTFIGAIGLFLYSIKSVSDGAQKLAGDHLRGLLSDIRENKFVAVLSGLVTATLVQSSSATTVVALSSVNAGLISLAQSIAVVMGASAGAAINSWIISLLGFHYNLFNLFLPLIAIGLPLYNSDKRQRSSIGELLIGVGLFFFSIDIMKGSAPVLSLGYTSPLLFIFIGTLITTIVQASSVTFIIAVILCSNGTLTLPMACALVLGANIGTCVMPVITSLKANTMARRTAVSNLLFNILAVCISILFFDQICGIINFGTTEFNIALFHTIVNVGTLLILIWFTRYIERIVIVLIKEKKRVDQDPFKLQFIKTSFIGSGEIALSQAKQEILNYSRDTYHMFTLVNEMANLSNSNVRLLSLYENVHLMEDESDNAEEEIVAFLREISTSTLSSDGEHVAFSLFKMIDEMESIADNIDHMAITLKHKSDLRILFTADMKHQLERMFSLTNEALKHMTMCMEREETNESIINKAYNIEDEINNYRNLMRNSMFELVDQKMIEFQQSTTFMELINECERIGDHVINVISSMPRE